MTNDSILKVGLCGILTIGLTASRLAAQGVPATIRSSLNTYEDDRIRIVVQECNRKLPDLICQAVLTSKSNDRNIDLNGNTIKIVDLEGNEYYPTSLRLANRISENNLIKAELVENVPFKASFIFTRIPANVTKFALLQIPVGGSISATAKFRDLTVVDRPSTSRNNITVKPPKTSIVPSKSTNPNPEISSENSSVCPDNTKVLYRATSKIYLMYICGAKTPTHYVGMAKDGTQGITLRLRYYDRSQFSADNGDTNYTIAANRLVIRKNNKLIYQEKIQVLQPLSGMVAEEVAPKIKPKKTSPVTTNIRKPSSSSQPAPTIKQQPASN